MENIVKSFQGINQSIPLSDNLDNQIKQSQLNNLTSQQLPQQQISPETNIDTLQTGGNNTSFLNFLNLVYL